ncbi:glutathione S-transferase family protein [Haloglomus litoreum]|uniref:glutathione S-transferase family protein n=1 Tax=Haloglomus litoreum TaxID=3034026 RepID=UPI0023E7AB01|nr:glutathione S-transferase C-terminal domain-containing protein [Haloglomus sp. DT116]
MGRNMLVDGKWHKDVEPWADGSGEYDRVTTSFRDRIRDEPGAKFPAEPGRYHLYVSRNCPWAHGAALVRRLAGLTDAVSMDVVDPRRGDEGWAFTPGKDGCTADTVNGFSYLRNVYRLADTGYTGRVTVPVLWDTARDTIVNNESIEIMRMLATEMGHLGDGIDLYPEGAREEIDEVVDAIYEPINDGVYRAGLADSQAAYETAVHDLFDALDHWDDVLADRRYLAAGRLSLADLRMFATLIRFDTAYHGLFRCNLRRIVDYEHLWPYVRDLYGTPGIAETVRLDHIREGYYGGIPELNPSGIVPVGPDLDLAADHDRDRLPGRSPAAATGR